MRIRTTSSGRSRRAHSLSPNLGRTPSPVCPDLIYDRHRANSDAFVKPGQIAKQPEVAPENSKPIVEPVPLPRERAMSRNDGYGCQRYRTSDPASGTYSAYDGLRHSCPYVPVRLL